MGKLDDGRVAFGEARFAPKRNTRASPPERKALSCEGKLCLASHKYWSVPTTTAKSQLHDLGPRQGPRCLQLAEI